MPSVGMIRSTRFFVPKSVLKDLNGLNGFQSDSSEIQSVKRGGYSDKWLQLVENSGEKVDAVHGYKSKSDGYEWNGVVWDENAVVRESVVNSSVAVESDETRENLMFENLMFGTVYSRKRRSLAKRKFPSSDDDNNLQEQFPEDALFGIQYARRNKRRKSILWPLDESSDRARTTFKELNGDDLEVKEHLVPELDREVSLSFIPRVVLSIVVQSSFSSSVYRISCFLVSILSFMRRRSRIRLPNLALFMCSEPISGAFSSNGIHFSCDSMSKIPDEDDPSSTGICKILGAQYCVPLFLVNFSAIPHSFLSLHSSISLRSQYLSCSLIRIPSEDFEITDRLGLSGTNSMVSKSISLNIGATELSGKLEGLYNLKWKTSSLRSVRGRNPRVINLKWKRSSIRSMRSSTSHNLIKANYSVEKVNDTADSQPNLQHKSALKNDIKDLKSLLVELRENIDSVSCSADILVIEHDRCYKEVGVKVMLQRLESKEWALGIKRQDLTRHMYKAQFIMRSCTTNRFTRAMIWNSESGWKLEFSNKQDWFIFKELFKECVERNLWASLSKSIPVPTALEVPGYENNIYVPFVRPDEYITVHEDEVTRALMQVANYDMDSDDEVWLERLNINTSGENSGFQLVSAENFGEIVDTFEKIAFNSPDDAFDEERDSNLCSHMNLGRDIVKTVYQYWLKKRKRKGSALLRVFQHQPSMKLQSPNEPVLQPQAPRSKPALLTREPNKPAVRPREPNKLVVRPREPNKPVVRKRRSSERTSQSGDGKQRSALTVPSVDQEMEDDIHRGQQDIFSAEEEMRIDQENRQRLEEAIASVNRYSETAVSKRKRAQALMEAADLALYWAAMAVKIAGAIRATGSSETVVSSFID